MLRPVEPGRQGGFGNPDSAVLIPLSTAQTRLGNSGAFRGSLKVSAVYIKIDQQSNMDAATAQVTAVLRERLLRLIGG